VYKGRVYGGIIVGLVARLVAKLIAGSISGVVRVMDCAEALRAVFAVFII